MISLACAGGAIKEALPVSCVVLMSLYKMLAGSRCSELRQFGLETELLIKNNDPQLLQHSTPAMESYFNRPSGTLPRQNGFYAATLLLMLVLDFVLNLLALLNLLPDFSPALKALSFFTPAFVFSAVTLTGSYLLSRGKTSGLTCLFMLYSLLGLANVIHLVIYLIKVDAVHVVMMITGTGCMFACRQIFNSAGFITFVLFCRSQRVATFARHMRMNSRNQS